MATKLNKRDVDVVMGLVLRRRRIALGLSQTELANQAGISFQQVQKYEKALNRVSISRLFDFAEALCDSPANLVSEMISILGLGQSALKPDEMMRQQFISSQSGQRALDSLIAIENATLLKSLVELLAEVRRVSHEISRDTELPENRVMDSCKSGWKRRRTGRRRQMHSGK